MHQSDTDSLNLTGIAHALSTVLLIVTLLNGQTHYAIIMLASLISMLACRYVFNGQGFIQFVLYGRTQRIAMLSRERRAKPGTKMQ